MKRKTARIINLTSCNCPKPLLPCCIPNLELDPFGIKLNGSYLKINAALRRYVSDVRETSSKQNSPVLLLNCKSIPYSCYETSCEGPIRKTQKKTTLSNTCKEQ
jgi:hypothetical protein